MTFVSLKQSLACSRVYRNSFLAFTLSLLLAGTTACDFVSPNNVFERDHKTAQNPTLKTDVTLNEAQDLARPASSEDGMNIDPAISIRGETMAGAKGLNNTLLFATPIEDQGARFDRLEDVVQDLRDEFDDVNPSVKRLVAIEKDIQDLVEQLEVLLTEEPTAIPPTPLTDTAPSVKSPAPLLSEKKPSPPLAAAAPSEPKSPAKAVTTSVDRSKPLIHSVRIADHKTKTRIVIETTQKLSYNHDIDNNENLLTLFFDKGAAEYGSIPKRSPSKKITAISDSQQNGSVILAFSLSGKSQVVKQGRIAPNKDNAYHRIFIDIER